MMRTFTVRPRLPLLVTVCLLLTVLLGALSCRTTTPQSNAPPPVTPTPAPVPAPMMSPPVTKLYYGTGIVRNTNPKFPSVELDHDEIKGLMPAMQMEFYVSDQALLQGLKPGMKVKFTLEDKGGAERIIALERR